MLRDGTTHGTSLRSDEPNWQPLVDLIGTNLADWFISMFDIELDDEVRVHAYKHIATRRYFHLAEDGRAFVYAGNERYREIRPRHAIYEAFAGWGPWTRSRATPWRTLPPCETRPLARRSAPSRCRRMRDAPRPAARRRAGDGRGAGAPLLRAAGRRTRQPLCGRR
jgi:hypothetical protein